MKKILFSIPFWIVFLFGAADYAQSQSAYTPNLHLELPLASPGSVGDKLNGNFVILDTDAGADTIQRFTNATKPTAPVVNQVIVVTDALSGTTCTAGGGTSNNTCQWTGSAWVVIGGASGGGGAAITFQDEGVTLSPTSDIINCTGTGINCTSAGGKIVFNVPGVTTVGPTVVQTNQSNTYTTGDQNAAAAASWTVPTATGAAPTASGRIAYDSTANRLKYGANGVAFTIANTAEIQFLNANLTALSGLTGVNGKMPYFTGPGTMALTNGLETPCPATGTQALNLSSIGTFVCGAIATGFTGGVNGTLPVYASATTATPSIVTQLGGNITIGGGLIVNCTTDCISLDYSTYVGHVPYSITFPYVGASASVAMTTGALTAGHAIVVGATGQLVDSGSTAGSGDVTLTGVQTLQNKTLVATGAGGNNTITLPLVASFDGGSITTSGGCQDPVKVQINSGPQEYAVLCATPASAQWGVKVPMLKGAVGTFIVRIEVNDSVSSSHVYAGTVKAQCRASGTAPSSTWGTTQTISATMTTASTSYQAASAAVTANGTCLADSSLYVQFDASGSMTDTGTARLIGVRIFQAS